MSDQGFADGAEASGASVFDRPSARLARALSLLGKSGITGGAAYPRALHGLARLGLVLPPLHFWPLLPLTALGTALVLAGLFALFLMAVLAGSAPRGLVLLLTAGPGVQLPLCLGLGLAFALAHLRQARALHLPRWRDL